jgi:ATP-dependent RNA helicase RhlE
MAFVGAQEITEINDNDSPTFESMELHPLLLKGIKRAGYDTPTPIQRGCILLAMKGNDLVASAVTGSGKTAAYLLPILHKIIGIKERGSPFTCTRCLILSPTRELALQINEQLVVKLVHTPPIKKSTYQRHV